MLKRNIRKSSKSSQPRKSRARVPFGGGVVGLTRAIACGDVNLARRIYPSICAAFGAPRLA